MLSRTARHLYRLMRPSRCSRSTGFDGRFQWKILRQYGWKSSPSCPMDVEAFGIEAADVQHAGRRRLARLGIVARAFFLRPFSALPGRALLRAMAKFSRNVTAERMFPRVDSERADAVPIDVGRRSRNPSVRQDGTSNQPRLVIVFVKKSPRGALRIAKMRNSLRPKPFHPARQTYYTILRRRNVSPPQNYPRQTKFHYLQIVEDLFRGRRRGC